jgi:hypothetical protein
MEGFALSTRSIFQILALGLLVAIVVGCGPSGPKTHSVTGKVTIDGEPAANVRITFQPVDEANQAASGTVESDGSYTLYTGVSGTPGAMAGKYKVVLTPDMGADTSYMDSGGTAPPDTSGEVPEEYRDPTTTPKEVEVTAGQNSIDIEI